MKKLWSFVSGLAASILVFAVVSGCGGAKFDAAKNVAVVVREDGSGTKSAFMEIIGLKGKTDPTGVIIQQGVAGVLTEVKGNPVAIAYDSLGYITSDVKILKLDGVDATVANIVNGSYKLSRPLSIIYKEPALDTAVNQAFLDFLKSSNAQRIISDEGYVPIVNNAPAYTVNPSLSGSISVGGSTSLQDLMVDLAQEFRRLQPSVQVAVSGGGSGTGYNDAERGVLTFGMISEEFAAEKAPSCVVYTVCKDGIAVIVNKANPLESITMGQLKNIYDKDAGSAAITKWSTLVS